MTKTMTCCDVMVYVKIITKTSQNVIIERKTLIDSCHKHA